MRTLAIMNNAQCIGPVHLEASSSCIPDPLAPPVRVLRSVDADRLPSRDVLQDLNDIGGRDEHGGLIHILHMDHYGGRGGRELHYEGSLVGHFNVQRVLIFGLKIQALRGKEGGCELPFYEEAPCRDGVSEGRAHHAAPSLPIKPPALPEWHLEGPLRPPHRPKGNQTGEPQNWFPVGWCRPLLGTVDTCEGISLCHNDWGYHWHLQAEAGTQRTVPYPCD